MAIQRVALVTGASSGFGLQTALELSRRGLRVFASMRDLGKAARLVEAASAASLSVETLQLDVTDEQSVRRAVAEVEERAGGVDVLVNNAGISIGGFFEDTRPEELRAVMETNFFGPASLMRAVVPGMRARRWGRIINLSSVSGRVGAPGFSAYAASKWALEGMTEALRNEVLPFGIHVVLVEPGMFRTEIFSANRKVAQASKPYARVVKRLEARVDQAVERLAGDPRVVAKVVADAATARRPKLRYLVGPDAYAAVFSSALAPERAREWFYRKLLALEGDDEA